MTKGPYRDGKIHVLSGQCETCIFRTGNLMHLQSGRVKGMVDGAKQDESAITCHSTLYRADVQPAVCRGFYDKYKTKPLQLAQAMELIEFDPIPTK